MFLTGGKMTKRYSVLACAVLVAACSSQDTRREANRGFEYMSEKEISSLVIADGLDTPDYTNRYRIPALEKDKSEFEMGSNVDIRPPLQVLALSSLMRADERSDDVVVWFNGRSAQDNVGTQITTLVQDYLTAKEIPFAVDESNAGVITTDYFEHGKVFAEFREITEDDFEQRYRYSLVEGSSQRTAGLKVELLGHGTRVDTALEENELTAKEKRRYELQMLNMVGIYYELQRLEEKKQQQQAKKEIALSVKNLTDDSLQVLLDMSFDNAWTLIPEALEKAGFSIEDHDKIDGNLTISFDAQDEDYWAEEDIAPLDIAEDDYILQLGETQGKTSLTFYDEDKHLLKNESVEKIVATLKDAIKAVNANK